MVSSYLATLVSGGTIEVSMVIQESTLPFEVLHREKVLDGITGLNLCKYRHDHEPWYYAKFYHKDLYCPINTLSYKR